MNTTIGDKETEMRTLSGALLLAVAVSETAWAQVTTRTLGAPDTRTSTQGVSAVVVRNGKLELVGSDRSIIINYAPSGTYRAGNVSLVVRDRAITELIGPADQLLANSSRVPAADELGSKAAPTEEPITARSTGVAGDGLGRVVVTSMSVARDGSLSLRAENGRVFKVPSGTYTSDVFSSSLVWDAGRVTRVVKR
jgi:hypothetical protein